MQDEVVITVIATGFEGRPVSKNDTDTVNHFGRSAQEKGQKLDGAFLKLFLSTNQISFLLNKSRITSSKSSGC